MVYLAQRLGYTTDDQTYNLVKKSEEVAKILRGLIKSLNLKG
ncbi:hypothetical protein A33Q_1782 [Indibacter alkaliphilus LW1]|uniref:Four helix bundle protein n=1 Tax=Indibacter alkaliphilus (strain CCUG 57479 / KCTC 22604 / LW1) TaxID=1189612 RepID=S2DE06_INDAL|nr:hypothetical protein A33Q_1782 [Indibacter alkaliphilus LW1]